MFNILFKDVAICSRPFELGEFRRVFDSFDSLFLILNPVSKTIIKHIILLEYQNSRRI